jgi:hypothetical protein
MHRASLVFLLKNDFSDYKAHDLKGILGFDKAFGVKCVGASVCVGGGGGGLAVYWNNDLDVTLKSISGYHINVMIETNTLHKWNGDLKDNTIIMCDQQGSRIGN